MVATELLDRPTNSSLLGAAVLWTASVGVLIGVVIGTVEWPIVGAFFLGIGGAVLGSAAGVVLLPIWLHVRPVGADRASRLLGRWVLAALAVGSGIGAVAGLAIGVFSYLPTAPVAMIEAAILAAPTAAAIGVLGALVHLVVRAAR